MYNNLNESIKEAGKILKTRGCVVKPKKWQAREVDLGMWEVNNILIEGMIPNNLEELQTLVKPNLPWAEDHFQERVSGEPMNPAPSYVNWPYYQQDEKWRINGKFSHTYPERMWTPSLKGIRYKYGNLGDVVNMLKEDLYTRQAYLPIWFPEDTGAIHGERVPCTLGYHFLVRNGYLNISYIIRSCDYRRHLRNDVYMAARLAQWMSEQVKVFPGILYMYIINLHVFEGEQNFI